MLDDAQRYFIPDETGGGVSLGRHPEGAGEWDDFLRAVEGWPCEWFSHPVRCTAIWRGLPG